MKKIDLSFAKCQYPPVVKANREWQQEFLNTKVVCMAEVIPLAVALF